MNLKNSPTVFAREATLNCPNCNHEIRLTESLAAPLIADVRRDFQEQIATKDAEVKKSLELVRQEREDLGRAREQIDDQVARKLAAERAQIAAAEAKKARESSAAELHAKDAEAAELRSALQANTAKLAEAQKAHAAVIRRERELQDKEREMDLSVEKRVQASVDAIRATAQQEADEAARLRVLEKERTIESMTRTIEELKRKAQQGSEQAQGEAFELNIEGLLTARFPADIIEHVGKGEIGADLVQHVNGKVGTPIGSILWESKRTKNWSDGWLAKLREDKRRCGADFALIVTHALPKGVEQFDLVEGVWVAHPRCALPVALALRQTAVEVANTRVIQQGQRTKGEQVYSYLTGTKFRQRVEASVERFNGMREDLDKERKFMVRQWAKREAQIIAVVETTVGMVGELQAIAGAAMPEIPCLDIALIDQQAVPPDTSAETD